MFHGKSLINNFFKYKRKVLPNVCKNCTRFNSTSQSPKVLFFGTDNFSLPSLQALHKNCSSDLGVVTSFKSPANCVRLYAEQQQLSLQRWPITTEQCAGYDLGVVVSFGHMIPAPIITAFPAGMINVHASLLPRWRGAAPIMYAIMHGDASTGVSIMKIEPHHFDIGAILAQRKMHIRTDVFMPELHAALAQMGADLLVDTVDNLTARLESAQSQNNAAATYAPKITSRITDVVWSELTATELFARHRALYGYRCLSTTFLDKQVQLLDLRLPEQTLTTSFLQPGEFNYQRTRRSLLISCACNTQLEILQLRIEGKKPMTAEDFNNGFLKRSKTSPLHFTQK